MERIEYVGLITPELYLKCQSLHLARLRHMLWLFPVAITLVSWLNTPSTAPHVILLPIAFGIGSLFTIFFTWFMARGNRRALRLSPHLQEGFSGTVTQQGLEFKSSTSSGIFPWSRFIKLKEQDDLILLYQGPNVFDIVAKEFFASPEAWDEARRIFHANVK